MQKLIFSFSLSDGRTKPFVQLSITQIVCRKEKHPLSLFPFMIYAKLNLFCKISRRFIEIQLAKTDETDAT